MHRGDGVSDPARKVTHMLQNVKEPRFQAINEAYASVFRPNRLTIGLVMPIESYAHDAVPGLSRHLERAELAESLGFSAVWLRDVPFNVPSFGDAGQVFDPFVYLGLLAGRTERIALGVASIVLPLRHPAHVAKAAASADVLSGGRVLLGIASGDRPQEYPAMGASFADRGALFRESYDHIRRLGADAPTFEGRFGRSAGDIDLLPKPVGGRLPLLVTGGSQQDADWIARHGDGWMLYPRDATTQARIIEDWRARVERAGGPPKPVMEPLYIDLVANPEEPPQPIHLGLRLGPRHLKRYLAAREAIGVNHIALNLRFNERDIEATMTELANDVLPEFSL